MVLLYMYRLSEWTERRGDNGKECTTEEKMDLYRYGDRTT